jgi:colanic acid biosynthesis glycosyl transferase WcaI
MGEIMTHILIISRYYPPEIAVAGVCVSEMATRLVKLGHQVTVLTTVPNHPTGIVPKQYRGHLMQSEMLDGIQVLRTWCYITQNKGFFRRILAQFSFGCLAPFLSWKHIGRPDIIIVGSPPLFNVIAGRVLARLKRCPLIFMVADIWPESAIQLGVLHNRTLIRLSEWLEWSTYQKASLVWAVTEGIRDTLIARGLAPEHIFLLTNGVDCTKFRPQAKAQARMELGWDERFTVLYVGGHGIMHGLTTLLDSAEQVLAQEDIHFIMAGEGSEKSALIAQSQKRHLTNITFIDAQAHQRIPLLLAACDVSLVPVRNVALFRGMLPVKMFEAMACARPMVLAVDGEARRVAEQEAKAAIAVEPENANALVAAIVYLYEHPEIGAEMGRRGREYVEFHFDYEHLAAALDARLTALLSKQGLATIAETPVYTNDASEIS